MPTPDLALATRKISRECCMRIARVAFVEALTRSKKVTAVHKANVLRISDGLFLECTRKVIRAALHLHGLEDGPLSLQEALHDEVSLAGRARTEATALATLAVLTLVVNATLRTVIAAKSDGASLKRYLPYIASLVLALTLAAIVVFEVLSRVGEGPAGQRNAARKVGKMATTAIWCLLLPLVAILRDHALRALAAKEIGLTLEAVFCRCRESKCARLPVLHCPTAVVDPST